MKSVELWTEQNEYNSANKLACIQTLIAWSQVTNKQDIKKIPSNECSGMECLQLYFFALSDLLPTLTSIFLQTLIAWLQVTNKQDIKKNSFK